MAGTPPTTVMAPICATGAKLLGSVFSELSVRFRRRGEVVLIAALVFGEGGLQDGAAALDELRGEFLAGGDPVD